jgi:hypothetical protein
MRGARFERCRVLAVRAQCGADDLVRFGESGVEVFGFDAAFDDGVGQYLAVN